MSAAPVSRDPWIWAAAAALSIATLFAELVTPLGYAVWLGYFLAVSVCLFQRRPQVPLILALLACVLLVVGYHLAPASNSASFSIVNRSMGGICFIATGLIAMQAIRARLHAEYMLWLQESENAVAVSLQGDLEPAQMAELALRILCEQLDAQVGALYRVQGQRLLLTGGIALPLSAVHELPLDNGQLGEVVQQARPRHLRGPQGAHLPIESALGAVRRPSCSSRRSPPTGAWSASWNWADLRSATMAAVRWRCWSAAWKPSVWPCAPRSCVRNWSNCWKKPSARARNCRPSRKNCG